MRVLHQPDQIGSGKLAELAVCEPRRRLFYSVVYPTQCKRCGQQTDIDKPMHARLPRCEKCGGELRRVWNSAPAVVYAAPGFSSTDGRLRKIIGAERADKFEHERDDAVRRAARGQLTEYEKGLETI